jgi:hypothetical protein
MIVNPKKNIFFLKKIKSIGKKQMTNLFDRLPDESPRQLLKKILKDETSSNLSSILVKKETEGPSVWIRIFERYVEACDAQHAAALQAFREYFSSLSVNDENLSKLTADELRRHLNNTPPPPPGASTSDPIVEPVPTSSVAVEMTLISLDDDTAEKKVANEETNGIVEI